MGICNLDNCIIDSLAFPWGEGGKKAGDVMLETLYLYFPGEGHVSIPNPLGGLQSFTFEATVNKLASIVSETGVVAGCWGVPSDSTQFLIFYNEYGTIYRAIVIDSTGAAIDTGYCESEILGETFHVAVTYSETKLCFYIDGELLAERATNGRAVVTRSGPLYLGHDTATHSDWDGWIGEVRIWDYARTQEQIRELMGVYKKVRAKGLLHTYHLDEKEGVVAKDSFSDNNGVISGAIWSELI